MRLFKHQLRSEQLVFWRSRESAVFVFLFPLLLFTLLTAVYTGRIYGRPAAWALLAGMLAYGVANTAFAGLALALAAIGIYGVVSYWVVQRTREIGIRMALGASAAQMRTLVLGQSIRLAAIGAAAGLAAALASSRLLSSLLYDVRPTDVITLVTVSVVLIAVALVASYIPARRASKVDPMVALRYE